MARNSYTFFTPLGTFASSGQAAAAHKCDKSTIMARCASDPDNYRRVVREPRAVTTGKWHTRREWPLSWSQYRGLDFETREQIYITWCSSNGRDPDADASAEDFHDAMDLILDVTVVDSELDLDTEAELSAQ
jgi:hypothetical protein